MKSMQIICTKILFGFHFHLHNPDIKTINVTRINNLKKVLHEGPNAHESTFKARIVKGADISIVTIGNPFLLLILNIAPVPKIM